jgi:hypothetical protein
MKEFCRREFRHCGGINEFLFSSLCTAETVWDVKRGLQHTKLTYNDISGACFKLNGRHERKDRHHERKDGYHERHDSYKWFHDGHNEIKKGIIYTYLGTETCLTG